MYRSLILSMAGVMVTLGVALVVESIVAGGVVGVLLGLLFIAAGSLRIRMLRRRPR